MLYEVTDVLSTERILSGTLEAKIQADCQFLQKRNRLPKIILFSRQKKLNWEAENTFINLTTQ